MACPAMAGKVGNIALLHTVDDRYCTRLLDFFHGSEVSQDFYDTPFLVKDPGKTVQTRFHAWSYRHRSNQSL
jgi:hypothetical protein